VSEDEVIEIPSGVIKIEQCAFFGLENLKKIVFPDSLQEIGDSALTYTGITEINIPDSVNSIGNNAFSMCDNLVSAKLPEKLSTINARLFDNDINLTTINPLPNLETIGPYAFASCYELSNLNFLKNVKSLDLTAFLKCLNIKDFSILPYDVSINLENCDFCPNIIVDELETKDLYFYKNVVYSADKKQIKLFTRTNYNKLEIIEGVEELDLSYVIGNCHFEKLILPASVKKLSFTNDYVISNFKKRNAEHEKHKETISYIYCAEELFSQFPKKMKKYVKPLSEK